MKIFNFQFSIFNYTILFLVLAVCAGCQSNLTMKRMAAKNPMLKDVVKTPTKMVDIWNTFVQVTPDGKSIRGIAGRIHFYPDGKKREAVKVDGELTVYVFDGKEEDPSRVKPIKVYRFTADKLESHYSHKKPLGHGYDFFLPFDELGGEERSLSILARFDDQLEGQFVVSQPVNTTLKGTRAEPKPEESSVREFLASRSILYDKLNTSDATGGNPDDIRQVAFEQSMPKMLDVKPDRTVTTISLNENMTRRLNHVSTETEVDSKVIEPHRLAAAPLRSVESAVWNQEPTAETRTRTERFANDGFPKTEYPKAEYLK